MASVNSGEFLSFRLRREERRDRRPAGRRTITDPGRIWPHSDSLARDAGVPGIPVRLDLRRGAVVTVFHDTLITVGAFSLTKTDISLTVIAAILTLIGYSNNDTIVVFDRIRENIKLMRAGEIWRRSSTGASIRP